MITKFFARTCLVLGVALTLAAMPELTEKEKNCRQKGQAGPTGELTCNAALPCDTILETCRPVTYRETVTGTQLKYCSCDEDTRGDNPSDDPTCHVYVVQTAQGWVRHCTAGPCPEGQGCKATDPHLVYQTCSCLQN